VDFAKAIGRGEHTVIKIEKGERKLTQDEFTAARKFMRVEHIPMLEDELARYRGNLYVFRERIKEEVLGEARKLRSYLASITEFPFEPELTMFYKIIDARLLLKEQELDKARDNLKLVESFLDKTTNEIRYHYYYGMGSLNVAMRNHKEGLQFYLLACEIEKNILEIEPSLRFNIALCYSRFGMYFLSATYLERIYHDFSHDITSTTGMMIDTNLGMSYSKIGHYKKAKELLCDALKRAEYLNNKLRIGYALHNLGCLSYIARDYENALNYLDQATNYFVQGDNAYLENIYYKILCLIAVRASKCKLELNHAMSLAEGDEHFSLLFNSLSHLILKEKESMQFIEDETTPYLLSRHQYFEALIFYEYLEDFYAKNKTKTSEIKASIGDIRMRMMREEINP